ncbi:MAG: hypothetical protein LUH05_05555, partial [Candidatus Gastranaerophilales bacterium]|nr:hypothetical protein [Candidatus Gastranaerophilales bacterium]
YSLFGESAILPKSYLNNRVDEIIGGEKDKFYEESVYYTYARHEYNTDFCGYIFKDDEYAFSELRKRLNILNETFETDEELRNNKVSFKRLNKYKGFIFKLEDIEKIKETNENSDILLKAKAYINYKNDNLKEAENLYNKYLEKHNWDYDSLIKLNDIYLKLNKPKELNELYTKMFMSGKREMIFLRKWLFLNYYVIEDYDTAFKINQYIIDLVKENNQDWYVNKAIILLKLNKKEEAEKLFKHIKEDLKDGEYFIQNFITENNISSFEDIYKQSKLQLLKVNEKEHHEA